MSAVYYNEFDKNAAQWLRELVKEGVIANGIVDDRSIVDVLPKELKSFDQCHFFAGIGVWSYALRKACWPDTRQVWTGSCPCFVSGTNVLTSAGQIPIEKVVLGTYVLTHLGRYKKVISTMSRSAFTVELRCNGTKTFTTPEHPFLVEKNGVNTWIPAQDTVNIHPYIVVDTDSIVLGPKVYAVIPTGLQETVYNLEVEEDNSYVANNFVVHNCQPFSSAGNQTGFEDERHLWPHFYRLIKQQKPSTIFGEQVASGAAKQWIDLVASDLEEMDYAFAAAALQARGLGAPHSRRRTFFVSYPNQKRQFWEGQFRLWSKGKQWTETSLSSARNSKTLGFWKNSTILPFTDNKERAIEPRYVKVANGASTYLGQVCQESCCEPEIDEIGKPVARQVVELWQTSVAMSDLYGDSVTHNYLHKFRNRLNRCAGHEIGTSVKISWNALDTNQKKRFSDKLNLNDLALISPFPLVEKPAYRNIRLSGYGNAIVAPVAEAFIRAAMLD